MRKFIKKIICVFPLILSIPANAEWKSDYYLKTQNKIECSTTVSDDSKNKFSIVLAKNTIANKREISIQLKPSITLYSKKEGLIADLSFQGKNKNTFKTRVRFIPKNSNSNVFLLNSSNITKKSFSKILNQIRKKKSLKIKVYDKNWVEYDFSFTLKKSNIALAKSLSRCEY